MICPSNQNQVSLELLSEKTNFFKSNPLYKVSVVFLLAPTGVGKTILISGLISCFPTHRILFLVHTIDLVNQTIEEFKRFGFDSISKVGDGEKDCSGRIVVSSIQSFSKLNIEDYCDKFDVVLVDEAHHCSGFPEKRKPSGGLYYRVLSNLLAPMRFALTATLPTDQETKLCLEGLIGNVVSELSFEDATDMKILAAPKIQLIKIDPFVNDDARTYADIYDKAIVENKIRNRLILRTIRQLNKQGLSTVTYVQRTKHISNLMEMAKETKTELHNVQGSTEADLRMELKNDLHHKKIMNVVATSVWTEGLNIPSLNAIILGGGGRDQKELIQKIGRGSRKHTDKNSFVVCDFIDSAKYLSQHFCERLGVYIERGWTINEKRIKDVGRTKT